MNKLFTFILVSLSFVGFAQLNFEGQFGGSNFIGFSARTEGLININKTTGQKIGISIGTGYSIHMRSLLVQSGVHYYIRNWGIGSEISGFVQNPFTLQYENLDLSFIAYPNVNYSFRFKNSSYLKVSAGVLLAFSRTNSFRSEPGFQFAGDAIPGIGISYGLALNRGK